MAQPVKLSDTLVNHARSTSKLADRSIAGQVEYWAHLGRAIDPLLYGAQAAELRARAEPELLSHLVSTAGESSGHPRLAEHLAGLPFPHYEPAAKAGEFVRIEANGQRTQGKFVGQQFIPSAASSSKHANGRTDQ